MYNDNNDNELVTYSDTKLPDWATTESRVVPYYNTETYLTFAENTEPCDIPLPTILSFCKTRDVKTPNRGTKLSSGIDFFIPEYSKELEQDIVNKSTRKNIDINSERIIIFPNETVLIPAGIHVYIVPGYDLVMHNKSGIASKYNLLVGAQVIDSDYRGEIHINLHNVGSEPVTLLYGQKIVQGIIRKVELMDIVEHNTLESLYHEDYTITSDRNSGGFGSTGIF